MNRRDLYRVLGIERNESPEGIRAAYVRLAKDLHPDRAGEASAPAFRQVQRAYDVLSDPRQKRQYDLERDRKRPARRWRPEQVPRRRPVEPLVPEPSPVAGSRWRRSVPVDELTDPLSTGVTPIGTGQRVPRRAVDLEVVISPEQAVRGGTYTVGIPVRLACAGCGGTGIQWPFACSVCGGRGWVPRERPVELRLPPGIPSGTVIELELEDERAVDLALRFHIVIDSGERAPPP